MKSDASFDCAGLMSEIHRDLAAVDAFRAAGCEPTWRPERTLRAQEREHREHEAALVGPRPDRGLRPGVVRPRAAGELRSTGPDRQRGQLS
jgi:hypothetical protein